MKVVVKIEGREAVPVRAIPLLTNWETMSPDVVAQALAWNEGEHHFKGLQAFRRYEGSRPIPAREWENEVCWQLTALNESMKVTESTPAAGLLEWRRKALEILPAGVYVWKDELEPMHCMRYGLDGETLLKNGVPVDDETHERLVALDFDPSIDDPEIQHLVMEGFMETPETEAAFTLAVCRVTRKFEIEHWAGLADVSPIEAAKVLCGEDPLSAHPFADSPEVKMLARIFEDRSKNEPARRALRHWALVALESGAKHHQDISKAVVHLTENTVTTSRAETLPSGDADGAPTQGAATPAAKAQSKETPKTRRERWLAMYEAEAKRKKHGALQRVADSEGVDRSNMGKDIAKAREARDEEKRSGSWASHLVKDGRRAR